MRRPSPNHGTLRLPNDDDQFVEVTGIVLSTCQCQSFLSHTFFDLKYGSIQVLCNAMRVSAFPEKSVTKVYGSMLLALRDGGWRSNFQEKSVMLNVTLE